MKSEQKYEVFRFCIVGGLSFLVDYALLFVCTELIHIFYWYSSAISFTVSVIFNYWLCIVFVFKGAEARNTRQAILFIASSIVGLGINQLCMWMFVEFIGIYYMIAKIVATIIVTFWNYVMKRKAVQG
ncbi:GtrA family protein [Megasphaera sueciensis]|jgi:putative flippase GtrA|uniref:GtrA family protein n=1 Tax=Megasphaera sueciensis TaxID=349094 RepID=UPI003CFF1639